MKKKVISLMVTILMIFTSACSDNGSEQSKEVVKPDSKDDIPEITIMLSAFEYDQFMFDSTLSNYVSKFEKDMGVKVNFEIVKPTVGNPVDSEYEKDYIKKASMKLYLKEGPELIFSDFIFINAVIEQGAALDVKGKIQNINKIYDGLLRDKTYYVPIGIRYYGRGLKRQMFEDLKLEEPDYELASADYERLMDQWIAKSKIHFISNEFSRLYNREILFNGIGNIEEKNIKINTPEIMQGIKSIRKEIFSGKYKLLEGYTYQSYYNAIFEISSPEYKVLQELQKKEKDYGVDNSISNLLRAGAISSESRKNAVIPLLGFKGGTPYLVTRGFMVNKNGKNLELAYEFINGLLSDEEQMELFKNGSSSYYPVNKDIEAEILKTEEHKVDDLRAMEIKKRALSKLKEGHHQIEPDRENKFNDISYEMKKDISKLILTDKPYEGEELKRELQKLEDKYNIWLNE